MQNKTRIQVRLSSSRQNVKPVFFIRHMSSKESDTLKSMTWVPYIKMFTIIDCNTGNQTKRICTVRVCLYEILEKNKLIYSDRRQVV